jgi:hypothetical protein
VVEQAGKDVVITDEKEGISPRQCQGGNFLCHPDALKLFYLENDNKSVR